MNIPGTQLFLFRYLDSVEIFAPNNTCSGTSLRSFPKPIVGSFGGYVAGKVNN